MGVLFEMTPIKIQHNSEVELVNTMGTDETIVEAARVSFGSRSTKGVERLLRYLRKNRHSSPFEACVMQFRIKTPIFVARQMMRHRTACLSGDVQLYFDLPGAKYRNRRQRHSMTIAEFYRKWMLGGVHLKNRLKNMELRSCNEDTGEIIVTHVNDIWCNGEKDVYEVTFDTGYKIKMTKDHNCLTSGGWLTLEEAVGLRHSKQQGHITWSSDTIKFACNGEFLYRDREWLKHQKESGKSVTEMANAAHTSYMSIRKWLKIHGLSFKPHEYAARSGASQRGRKRNFKKWAHSIEGLRAISAARSGKRSNFWKGGITKERALIGVWTSKVAHDIHKNNNYTCVICLNHSDKLHAHHIDPVWHAPELAYSLSNLTSVCSECHRRLHSNFLELQFKDRYLSGTGINTIFHDNLLPDTIKHKIGTSTKLIRKWTSIKSIHYVGKEITYDIGVSGPYHNFVANGLIVHNSVNEISGRYKELEPLFYLPTVWRKQDTKNKQASSDEEVTEFEEWIFQQKYQFCYDTYEYALGTGISRELARMILPVGIYTEFVWTANLHNIFHFLKLRLAQEAQQEIREVAEKIAEYVKEKYPIAYAAFREYDLGETTGGEK